MNQTKFENNILKVDGMKEKIDSLLDDFEAIKNSMLELVGISEEAFTTKYANIAIKESQQKLADYGRIPDRFQDSNGEQWLANLCVGLILKGELQYSK